MRRKLAAVLAAGGIGVAALLAVPTPANAHTMTQGKDFVTHGYSGYSFSICDVEDDGHAVWAGFYLEGSYDYHVGTVSYPTDAAGVNCSGYALARQLTNIRVVENRPGSSNNWYGPWHGYPVTGN